MAALATRPELAEFELPRIRDAVLRLVLGEGLVPMLTPTRAVPAPRDALYRLPSTYNQAALREGLSLETPLTLASTAAGTGLELSTVDAVAVYLLTEVPPAERPGWVLRRCERASFRLTVRGKSIEDREERVRTLEAEIERFCARRLPKLVELGVLLPAGERGTA